MLHEQTIKGFKIMYLIVRDVGEELFGQDSVSFKDSAGTS